MIELLQCRLQRLLDFGRNSTYSVSRNVSGRCAAPRSAKFRNRVEGARTLLGKTTQSCKLRCLRWHPLSSSSR